MIDATMFLYQLVGVLAMMIVPLILIASFIWMIAKTYKGIFRSITK